MRCLLDTNICSSFVRGQTDLFVRGTARDWSDLAISAVTAHELEFWAVATAPRRMESVRNFLGLIAILPFDAAAAAGAAKVRVALRAKPLGAYDALIAGHALALGLILITADADFKRVPGLRTENWLKR